MPDENKDQDQRGPEGPLDLRELEYQEMLRAAAVINPRALGDSLNIMSATSTSENILVGSSPPPGSVFHPNLPLASVAGVSLAEVNRVRQESNAGGENRRLMWLKVGNDFLRVYIKFLDLAQEDLQDGEPRRTFEVVGVTDYGGKKLEVPDNLDQLIDQKISRVREKERRALEEKASAPS